MKDLFSAPPPRLPAPAATQLPRRKLHAGHFAFMRALVQGLDARVGWERYLRGEGEGADARSLRATIAWLRDEFAAAARRAGRHGTARLVLIDPARVRDAVEARPALDEFVAVEGLDGFSQAEQIAAYEAAHGRPSRTQRRRARLIERQLEALAWLEQQVAQPPRPTDSVDHWLNPLLARPLAAAGLPTLADLARHIGGHGARWHRRVRGIGATKADRIRQWLVAHQASLGPLPTDPRLATTGRPEPRPHRPNDAPWHPRSAAPDPPKSASAHSILRVIGMAPPRPGSHPAASAEPPGNPDSNAAPPGTPLNDFSVPEQLDGRRGSNRALLRPGGPPTTHTPDDEPTDRQAIEAWLASRAAAPHTQRAYRREAERFQMWCVLQRGKALSSADEDDCAAYRAFLADPQPRERWCAEQAPGRWSPLWRPFRGPLAPAAQRQAVAVLSSLFTFLVDQRYLAANPWRSRRRPGTGPRVALDARRSLDPAHWALLRQAVQARRQTDGSAGQRLSVAVHWLYATGLRLSEIVAARVDDLRCEPTEAGAHTHDSTWLLAVPGQRPRQVLVPASVIGDLADYLASRGLDPDPLASANRGAHLLGRATDRGERAPNLPPLPFDAKAGIRADTLHRQIKRLFSDCAARLAAQGDAEAATRLAGASAHWLRHTHARHLIDHGLPLEAARQQLGHAALATTAAYLPGNRARPLDAWRAAWAAAERATLADTRCTTQDNTSE